MFALAAAGTLAAAPGCAVDPEGDSAEADEAEISAPGGRFGPALFRNDLYTYLKRDGHYSDEQIRQLVLMPTEEALTARGAMQAYDAAFARMRPTDFYQQGLVTPLVKKIGPNGPLENELRRNPVHIVVVPGIFGEFIPVSPFEEVFRYGGAASVTWDRKMKALEAEPAKNEDLVHDRQFAAAEVKDVSRSMRDLVRVGSIDDSDGTPLVTITYLRPELGSLETFGTLDENADYYLTRLEKYFKIIGAPEHLYVMGYSRGTPTALNLVSRAQAAHAPWMPKLRGVIALAGVIYGTQLADAALADGPQRRMLDTMTDFVENKLESCTGPTPGALLMTRNFGHWTAFLAREALAARGMTNQNEALSREGIQTDFADVGRIVSFTRRVLFGDPQKVFAGDGDSSAILGVLHMNAPSAEYCQNIERFKKTAVQVVKGVQTLTTQARTDWFHTHTLPSNIRYYAITGTMGDATAKGAPVSPLTLNETAYDTRSLDFRSLRGNYYDLLAASQNQLQDSQVPVQRARFWPDVHAAMNPAQQPLKTYFMGTVGIHHWGLSFPRAFSTNDGVGANPYPRTLLLKSIATFVAQVESRGGS
ncbi:MAG: hypothetical protein JWP87_6073 [Labilithrix sp.]|nr:hypothetical protein [Labilithrix sp.]